MKKKDLKEVIISRDKDVAELMRQIAVHVRDKKDLRLSLTRVTDAWKKERDSQPLKPVVKRQHAALVETLEQIQEVQNNLVHAINKLDDEV